MKTFFTRFRQLLPLLAIGFQQYVAAQVLLNPATQPKFVNQLPIPSVLDTRSGGNFSVTIGAFTQYLGLVDPVSGAQLQTSVWGYNGKYPGPTVLARSGVPTTFYWVNNLVNGSGPLQHLLPVDASLHWAFSGVDNWHSRGVPIVTHLHGGLTESASDGLADQWYTPNFTYKGPGFIKGQTEPYLRGKKNPTFMQITRKPQQHGTMTMHSASPG